MYTDVAAAAVSAVHRQQFHLVSLFTRLGSLDGVLQGLLTFLSAAAEAHSFRDPSRICENGAVYDFLFTPNNHGSFSMIRDGEFYRLTDVSATFGGHWPYRPLTRRLNFQQLAARVRSIEIEI